MEYSSVPKYMIAVDYIRNQIRSGKYRVGELLPGQRVIAGLLDLSRPSVKRAIDLLEREGVVECNPSIGSIVKSNVSAGLLVGYQIQDLQDPFHMELIRELDNLLHRYQGGLVIQQGADDDRLSRIGATHSVKHHQLYRDSTSDRVPTVYIGNVNGPVNMVVSDIPSGMRQIYDHLRALGHRRIAYVSPFGSGQDVQLQSFLDALDSGGLRLDPQHHFLADPLDLRSCDQVIQAIRAAASPPTALVCYNDWLAIAVMSATKRAGLDIPADLSVTGYDDLYISSLLQVPLTTVRFSRRETAERTLELLMDSGSRRNQTKVVETRLIARESTRPVA